MKQQNLVLDHEFNLLLDKSKSSKLFSKVDGTSIYAIESIVDKAGCQRSEFKCAMTN